MKASYNWLRSLVPGLGASPDEIATRLTAAGLEVEGLRAYGEASRTCVVAVVVATRPHPTKSGLNLVAVATSSDPTSPALEVVCGAPNVPPPGNLVVLAPLGASLPARRLRVERRTIGGVVSEGMLCSEAELGLTEASDGILVLPAGSATPGASLAEAIPATFDTILEIGLTPNRPDGLGHVGLARELAVLYALPFRGPRPSTPAQAADGSVLPGTTTESVVQVDILDRERCPRYAAAAVVDVVVAPSPLWLRCRLASLGLRPISNVVDVTNLVMLEFGHPMHAFDLDRVRPSTHDAVPPPKAKRLVVRRAEPGELLETLDGVRHTLVEDDLVIADGAGAVALAGVMGGASSEITQATRRVLFECAYFEPRGIRRAARRHGLHTDSSHRFERGVDPSDIEDVLASAVALATEIGPARALHGVLDVRGAASPLPSVPLRSSRLDAILGVSIPWPEAVGVLRRLGFGLEQEGTGRASFSIPPHRPDVSREIDLIEEVARVRGMDAIPAVLPRIRPTREIAPREQSTRRARSAGVELGLSEAVTYSFVSRSALEQVGAPSPAVVLKNPLSSDQEVMRTSLLPGLLEALSRARRYGERDARLFTVGSTFLGEGGGSGLPEERLGFAAILAGERAVYMGKPETVDVWDAKGLAEGFAARMVPFAPVSVERFSGSERPSHLHPRGAARVLLDGAAVGAFGPLHPDVADAFDLGPAVVVVEFDLGGLASKERPPSRFSAIPKFPGSRRDLAVVVPSDVTAGEVEAAVRRAAGVLAAEVSLFDQFVGGSIAAGHKSLAFRILYRADARTITDAEVDTEHAKAVAAVELEFGGTLRG